MSSNALHPRITPRRCISQAATKHECNTSPLVPERSSDASSRPWPEDAADDKSSMRAKFEMMIRAAQNEICAAVEEVDGQKFQEDNWTRPGGRACQILGGNAGRNTSSDVV